MTRRSALAAFGGRATTTARDRAPDIVVIGAGIVGLATAYYLAKDGAHVAVLEARDVAAGTTGACDGNIMVQSKQPGPMLEFAKAALILYSDLLADLDPSTEYVQHGSLLVFDDESDAEAMRPAIRAQQAAGLNVVELGAKEVLDLQPGLAAHIVGGTYLGTDANINQLALCFALARRATALGTRIRLRVPVVRILADRDHVSGVLTESGEFVPTRCVVVAAGVWSPRLLEPLQLELPISPRKGHILVTERCTRMLTTSLVSPSYIKHKHSGTSELLAATRAVSFSLDQTHSGTMFVGSSREHVGFDNSISIDVVRAIGRLAVRTFPALRSVRLIRAFCGFRPTTPDGRPVIGTWPEYRGLYVASGHEGDGIALGPMTGKLIADLVSNRPPVVDLAPFQPQRFAVRNATTT